MEIFELLSIGVRMNASDVHIAPAHHPILRVNGDLILLKNQPVFTAVDSKKLIYSLLDENQKHQLESELELDFAIELPQLARFRVNVFHQAQGIAAVFRIIPQQIRSLDQLGMPSVFKNLLNLPNGLILVTGATGSGKSTTLAAMIDFINQTRACHVITIEDPIEFVHASQKSLVTQRQVQRDTHHFSSALRAALREDPDVIMVGEMRDLETIRLALTAAETGHLVLATLHTSSAPKAITRIVDVFPDGEKSMIRNMLAESLQAVVCQQLVKTSSNKRAAAFEIMVCTNAMRNLIRENKIAQMCSAMQTGGESGMCTFEQYFKILENKGFIIN